MWVMANRGSRAADGKSAVHSQEYLDRATMFGELELVLADWSDEAQEDLVLVAMNGILSPDFETCMRLWTAAMLVARRDHRD